MNRAFESRANRLRRMYTTGPGAQVLRQVEPISATEARVFLDGDVRTNVNFGSNNYLGFANDPYIAEKACNAIRTAGLSMCGSPLLNGANPQHRQLEERLADFKGTEDAILFPSGFAANLAWTQALVQKGDVVNYDEYAHTSFQQGIAHLPQQSVRKFEHNTLPPITSDAPLEGREFTFVEGVYSMHGDLPPLDKLSSSMRPSSTLVVDDAHGTCTLGQSGRGIFEHFGLTPEDAIIVGTLSKGFGAVGGYICSDRDTVFCLRAMSNTSIFSASLPLPIVAGVLAALDLLEREPHRVEWLRSNIKHVVDGMQHLGVKPDHCTPIISIKLPKKKNVHSVVRNLHRLGHFVNGVSYPAVPRNEQRVRISLSALHTRDQISSLIDALSLELSSDT